MSNIQQINRRDFVKLFGLASSGIILGCTISSDKKEFLPQTDGIFTPNLFVQMQQDGNIVLPGSFIPAAERYQLAPRLDRWVMRNTIEYLQQHKNIDSIEMICINLSGQSIGDRAFHRDVTDLLIKAGERICYKLCIEITETAVVTNIADAALFI